MITHTDAAVPLGTAAAGRGEVTEAVTGGWSCLGAEAAPARDARAEQ